MKVFTATQITVRNVAYKILCKLRTFIKHCLLLFLYSIVSFNVADCVKSPCRYVKVGNRWVLLNGVICFISGKVLVNCLMGMSRSSTCVLAYLMLRKDMTAMDALTVVRRHREVRPNDGFLKQLAELDNQLRRDRGQLQSRNSSTLVLPAVK